MSKDVAGITYLEEKFGKQALQGATKALERFELEVPSWGFGRGGTRFGTYNAGFEPEQRAGKLKWAGILHRLTGRGERVALHFPWDGEGPDCAEKLQAELEEYGLKAGAVNSNLFTPRGKLDAKLRFGSLTSPFPEVREAAVAHNLECLEIGRRLGSTVLSLWVPDGTNSPGQMSFYDQANRLEECLQEIYDNLQDDELLLVEYKLFEPGFYSTAIADWGRALALCEDLGPKAKVLIDLGHHAAGVNIEQIVALLARRGKLGGFHFNDKQYADDDLATGSLDPARLFRVFVALVEAQARDILQLSEIAFMIDQSHCVKHPLLEMIESVCNIEKALCKACLVDYPALWAVQADGRVVTADRILNDAFEADVQPLLASYRAENGLPEDPLAAAIAEYGEKVGS